MIAWVLAGAEEQVGNLPAAERPVIAAVENQEVRTQQADRQGAVLGRLVDPGAKARGMLGSQHEDVVLADPCQGPTDHVGRDEQHDLLGPHRRVRNEVTRAEKPGLLEIETDEHQAAAWRIGRGGQGSGHLQHHGHSRRVVVGAGVEYSAPNAQVIVMRCYDHPLVLEDGIGPAQNGPDISPLDPPGLGGRDLLDELSLKERFELEAAELVDQEGGGLAGSLAPPAFHLGRRQLRDDCLQSLLLWPGGRLRLGSTDDDDTDRDHSSRGPDQQRANDRSRFPRHQIVEFWANLSVRHNRSFDGNIFFESPAPAEQVWHVSLVLGTASLHGGGSCREAHGSRRSPSSRLFWALARSNLRRLRTGTTTCTGHTCLPRSRATVSSTMGSTTAGIAILGNSGLFPRFRGPTTGTTMVAIGFWASSGTRTAGTNGTRRSFTRATTSCSTSFETQPVKFVVWVLPRNRLGSFLPHGRMPRRFRGAPATADRLTQRERHLIIRFGGPVNLIEIDPLILGMGLGDVAGSKDHTGEAAGAQWAGVGAIRYADDPGLMSGPAPDRLLERLNPLLQPRNQGGQADPGLVELHALQASQAVAEELQDRRGRLFGLLPWYQAPIDLDLAPVGNDVDALPSFDSADRKAGRADNRVGHCCTKNAGVLGQSVEHPAHPVDGIDSPVRSRAMAGHAPG